MRTLTNNRFKIKINNKLKQNNIYINNIHPAKHTHKQTYFLLVYFCPFLPSTFSFSGKYRCFQHPKWRAAFPTCFVYQMHLLKTQLDSPETTDWHKSHLFQQLWLVTMILYFYRTYCQTSWLCRPVRGHFYFLSCHLKGLCLEVVFVHCFWNSNSVKKCIHYLFVREFTSLLFDAVLLLNHIRLPLGLVQLHLRLLSCLFHRMNYFLLAYLHSKNRGQP